MGVKIVFHPLFVIILIISFALGFGIFMVALLSAVIIHELSHTIAAQHFGICVKEMRLLPFGAEVSIDCAFLLDDKKIIILLAGAFGNITIAVVCGSLLWLFPNLFMFLEIIVIANVVPAVLNLLPIYPLDGGKILRLILPSCIVGFFVFLSNLFFVGLFILSCFFFFNIPLLLLCVLMVISINFELKHTLFISKINSAIKSKSGRIVEVAITENMTIFDVSRLASTKYYTRFVIADRNNKVFYESDLEKMLLNNRIDITIGQVV